MKDHLSKVDVVWSFLAKMLPMAIGVITLPIILSNLNQNEIAMNYILLSITSFVILFDMGFSTQFSRNFVFIFSGGQDIEAEGYTKEVENFINYRLLKQLIQSAKVLYGLLSFILFISLISFGSWYIYVFSDGFTFIDNILYIWIVYIISTVYDFYYKFYTPLLLGEGKIKEASKVTTLTCIVKAIFIVLLIYCGLGLWAVVLATAVSVIFARILSKYYFYTEEIKTELRKYKISISEIKITCKKLWFLAKRQSIVRISTFASMQLSVFFTGAYLMKQDVASYGLLLQLVGLISTTANTLFFSYTPFFSRYRIKGEKEKLYYYLCLSIGSCFSIFLLGGIVLFGIVPYALILIKSNATLPLFYISIIYFISKLLVDQHCICSIYLSTKNKIYDLQSSSIIGFVTAIGLYIMLNCTSLELLGVVLVQFIVQLSYPNWKWPYEVCKELNVSYAKIIKDSCRFFLIVVSKFIVSLFK